MTAPVQDWREFALGDLLRFSNGINADKSAYGTGVPFANVLEVITNESIAEADIPGRIAIDPKLRRRYEVKPGDVLFNRTSETPDEVGLSSVYLGAEPIVFGGFVFRGQPLTEELSTAYSKYAFRSPLVRNQIVARGQGGIRANIGQRDLRSVTVRLPSRSEQSAIACALDDVSALIATLKRQIAKKQAIKQGLMQQLLTGLTRLPGFTLSWEVKKLGQLLTPRTERFDGMGELDVLTCTKHQGFVRSLDYFKNQVFSRNLSGYRIICRGDIGYPSNHVEEGSIGVQDVVDQGLVSPIYVVMRPAVDVDTFFVQRQLKLDAFRQEFARATNASVDRRGSLRWPQFSQIEVLVPQVEEQQAISEILRDADVEIDVLENRLAKARDIKTGMMQDLLTGRTRLPAETVA